MLKPSAVDQVIIAAQKIYTAQAYDVMDRLIVAKDAVTGLLPLHVKTDGGKLVASEIQSLDSRLLRPDEWRLLGSRQRNGKLEPLCLAGSSGGAIEAHPLPLPIQSY